MDTQTTWLINRIRTIYARDHRPGTWAWIADLRPEIGGTRAQQDEAFRTIGRQRDVTIVPESNQKVLKAYQRAGAVEIGNQTKHLISIG